MNNILLTFILLSIINVIFSTIRTILTIKGGKTVASLISGGYFAFYNIMLVYTVADFPMWQKCLITFVANVVGVFVVKFAEEKMRKDQLWKLEITFRKEFLAKIVEELNNEDISYNYLNDVGKYCIFNIYCATQEQTAKALTICKEYNGKAFASETKLM